MLLAFVCDVKAQGLWVHSVRPRGVAGVSGSSAVDAEVRQRSRSSLSRSRVAESCSSTGALQGSCCQISEAPVSWGWFDQGEV